jgi:hypothetical protein
VDNGGDHLEDDDSTVTKLPRTPLDHLKSRKKRVTRRVPIAMDNQLLVARDEAKSRFMQADLQAKMGGTRGIRTQEDQERIAELREELEEAEQALAGNVEWFEARSLGQKAWDELVSKHPPTDEQRKQAKKDGIGALLYNQDTFLPAVVAACCYWVHTDDDGEEVLEPLTVKFVDYMQNDPETPWTQGEILELAEVSTEVNQNTRRVGDLGNASRRTR